MQKVKTNRNAFTIVELVIVIAVIAILAAVLIPTFVSLIRKANESVDMQMVKSMNTVLEAEEITDNKPGNVIAAKQILIDNGITQFKPVDSAYVFYWISTDNRVVLYSAEDNKVTYPKEYKKAQKLDTTWFDLNYAEDDVVEVPVIEPAEGQTLTQALIAALGDASVTQDTYLTLPANHDLTMDANEHTQFIVATAKNGVGKKIHLDLNGNKIVVNSPDYAFYIYPNGVLELLNGSVEFNDSPSNGKGIFIAQSGASLVLRNMKVSGTAYAGIFPASVANEVVIDNSEINVKAYYAFSTNGLTTDDLRVNITNSKIVNESSMGVGVLINVKSVTYIEKSEITGVEQGLALRSGEANIVDSTISISKVNLSSIFKYQDFAAGCGYYGYWNQGNAFPAAVLVAGDYSEANDNNVYSYAGDVTVKMINVKLNSTDANKIPTVLMASSDPNKKVSIEYDDASNVGNILVYGSNWEPTDDNVGVTITSHDNTLYVNGKKATLVNGKTEIAK